MGGLNTEDYDQNWKCYEGVVCWWRAEAKRGMREGVEGRLLTTLWSIQIQILLVLRFNTALHNIVPQYYFFRILTTIWSNSILLILWHCIQMWCCIQIRSILCFFINLNILSKNTPIVLVILWCIKVRQYCVRLEILRYYIKIHQFYVSWVRATLSCSESDDSWPPRRMINTREAGDANLRSVTLHQIVAEYAHSIFWWMLHIISNLISK